MGRDMSRLRRATQNILALSDTLLPPLDGPRIVIYHQVGAGGSGEINVTIEAFHRQLDWFEANGTIVSLEEAIRRRGEPSAERLYVLTFDDGYRDVFQNAYPLMRERRIPFTLYLTSGPIDNPGDFPDWPGEPMTWDQAQEMYGSGLMTLGAHTHTHPDLRCVDPETAAAEIAVSNHLIEQRLGSAPRHFTYPKGWWSETADPVVRQSYATATLGMGSPITPDSDPHTLNRVAVVRSDSFWAFRRKMITGGRAESQIRRLRHRYVGP